MTASGGGEGEGETPNLHFPVIEDSYFFPQNKFTSGRIPQQQQQQVGVARKRRKNARARIVDALSVDHDHHHHSPAGFPPNDALISRRVS
jgi:hypothetical protein